MVHQDSANNVIIKKGATKGYENAPTVVIQGHMVWFVLKIQMWFTISSKTLLK